MVKNKKFLIIFLILFILLLGAFGLSFLDYTPQSVIKQSCDYDSDCPGTQVCHLNECQTKCDVLSKVYHQSEECVELSGGLCSGDDLYYCTDDNVLRLQYPSYYEYFCYLNGNFSNDYSITPCANGCRNGQCKEQVCFPNAEFCDDNTVKLCSSDGMSLSIVDVCDDDESCYEQTYTEASCRPNQIYYCTNNNIDCYWSTSYLKDKCYDSLEECMGSRVVYCLNKDKTKCIKRSGECKPGELTYRGSQLEDVKATCEGQIGSDCGYIRLFGVDLFPDYWCILLSKINNFFKELRIITAIIAGIICGLLAVFLLNDYKVKKNEIKLIAFLIISIGIGLLFYFVLLTDIPSIAATIIALISLSYLSGIISNILRGLFKNNTVGFSYIFSILLSAYLWWLVYKTFWIGIIVLIIYFVFSLIIKVIIPYRLRSIQR